MTFIGCSIMMQNQVIVPECILLRDEGYTVLEIRKITNHHDNNIRKNGYTDSMRMVLMVLYLENIYEMLTRLQII